MDKYEYKVCLEDIKALISEGRYVEAVEIADTIDWLKKVKSVRTLCMVSDLYKINRRYPESRDVLMKAFGLDPGNAQIIYALCILELKLDEYLRALQLFNEFTRVAPRDPNRFILQYKLYEAQNVSLEERTAVLEELKKRTFKDQWVYELATLYDRRGLYARCAELCDELIASGKTKYVRQALELKKTHSPLTPEQQSVYNRMLAVNQPVLETQRGGSVQRPNRRNMAESEKTTVRTEDEAPVQETVKRPEHREEYRVRPMDENMVNTVNLQAAVAEGFREIMQQEPSPEEKKAIHEARREEVRREFRKDLVPGDAPRETSELDRREFRKAREEAAAARALMREKEAAAEPKEEQIDAEPAEVPETVQAEVPEVVPDEVPAAEPAEKPEEGRAEQSAAEPSEEAEPAEENEAEPEQDVDVIEQPTAVIETVSEPKTQDRVSRTEKQRSAQDMYDDAHIMQEAGGQYSLLIDEHQPAEAPAEETKKTVTGAYAQEKMESWEKMRRQNDERHARENIQKIQDTTASLIAAFDAEIGHGILQDIEARTADEARSERFRRAVPEGGELSDGMTDNERLHVDLTRPEEERRENRDTLVMDVEAESATRVWRGETITRAAAQQEAVSSRFTPVTAEDESEDGLSETQEIAELIRQEFEDEEPEEESESWPEQLSESDRRRTAAMKKRRLSEKLASVRETSPMNEEAAAADRAYREAQNSRYGKEEPEEEEDDRYRDEEPAEDDRYRDEEPAEDDRYRDEELAEDDRYRDEEPEEDDRYRDEEPAEDDRYRDEEPAEDDRYRDEEPAEDHRYRNEEPAEAAGTEEKSAEPDENTIRAERERKKEEAARIHAMSVDQKRMFGPYLTEKNTRTMVLKTIDEISLASYTGNVVITGEPGAGMTELAMALLKNVRLSDSNFSGRVAVTNGASINRKDPESIIRKLDEGGLIIEKASALSSESVEALHKALEKEDRGIVVVLTDGFKAMERLFHTNPVLSKNFTCRVDIHPLSDDELVHLTVRYADRKGYSIDNMAVLALHSRIAAMQTIDHHVTADEARVIVDEAIAYAEKKTPSNIMGSMFGKRKSEDGKKILNEKDFTHYEG